MNKLFLKIVFLAQIFFAITDFLPTPPRQRTIYLKGERDFEENTAYWRIVAKGDRAATHSLLVWPGGRISLAQISGIAEIQTGTFENGTFFYDEGRLSQHWIDAAKAIAPTIAKAFEAKYVPLNLNPQRGTIAIGHKLASDYALEILTLGKRTPHETKEYCIVKKSNDMGTQALDLLLFWNSEDHSWVEAQIGGLSSVAPSSKTLQQWIAPGGCVSNFGDPEQALTAYNARIQGSPSASLHTGITAQQFMAAKPAPLVPPGLLMGGGIVAILALVAGSITGLAVWWSKRKGKAKRKWDKSPQRAQLKLPLRV